MHERKPSSDGETRTTKILRTWHGTTRAEDAQRYVAYMSETGYRGLRGTPGNVGVVGLLRVVGDRAEHVVMSLWESEESIRRFAGDDIGRAVFYPEDDRFLVEKDEHVDHFEVVFEDGWGGA
jgi:heme-degrading monooxygenase HmoA